MRDWRRLVGVMCLAAAFACSLVLVGVLTLLSTVAGVAVGRLRTVRLHTAAALAASRTALLALIRRRRRV